MRHQGGELAGGAAQLAILFEAARDFGAAANQFFAAARHAAGLFAFREAVTLSRRALRGARGAAGGRRARCRSSSASS